VSGADLLVTVAGLLVEDHPRAGARLGLANASLHVELLVLGAGLGFAGAGLHVESLPLLAGDGLALVLAAVKLLASRALLVLAGALLDLLVLGALALAIVEVERLALDGALLLVADAGVAVEHLPLLAVALDALASVGVQGLVHKALDVLTLAVGAVEQLVDGAGLGDAVAVGGVELLVDLALDGDALALGVEPLDRGAGLGHTLASVVVQLLDNGAGLGNALAGALLQDLEDGALLEDASAGAGVESLEHLALDLVAVASLLVERLPLLALLGLALAVVEVELLGLAALVAVAVARLLVERLPDEALLVVTLAVGHVELLVRGARLEDAAVAAEVERLPDLALDLLAAALGDVEALAVGALLVAALLVLLVRDLVGAALADASLVVEVLALDRTHLLVAVASLLVEGLPLLAALPDADAVLSHVAALVDLAGSAGALTGREVELLVHLGAGLADAVAGLLVELLVLVAADLVLAHAVVAVELLVDLAGAGVAHTRGHVELLVDEAGTLLALASGHVEVLPHGATPLEHALTGLVDKLLEDLASLLDTVAGLLVEDHRGRGALDVLTLAGLAAETLVHLAAGLGDAVARGARENLPDVALLVLALTVVHAESLPDLALVALALAGGLAESLVDGALALGALVGDGVELLPHLADDGLAGAGGGVKLLAAGALLVLALAPDNRLVLGALAVASLLVQLGAGGSALDDLAIARLHVEVLVHLASLTLAGAGLNHEGLERAAPDRVTLARGRVEHLVDLALLELAETGGGVELLEHLALTSVAVARLGVELLEDLAGLGRTHASLLVQHLVRLARAGHALASLTVEQLVVLADLVLTLARDRVDGLVHVAHLLLALAVLPVEELARDSALDVSATGLLSVDLLVDGAVPDALARGVALLAGRALVADALAADEVEPRVALEPDAQGAHKRGVLGAGNLLAQARVVALLTNNAGDALAHGALELEARVTAVALAFDLGESRIALEDTLATLELVAGLALEALAVNLGVALSAHEDALSRLAVEDVVGGAVLVHAVVADELLVVLADDLLALLGLRVALLAIGARLVLALAVHPLLVVSTAGHALAVLLLLGVGAVGHALAVHVALRRGADAGALLTNELEAVAAAKAAPVDLSGTLGALDRPDAVAIGVFLGAGGADDLAHALAVLLDGVGGADDLAHTLAVLLNGIRGADHDALALAALLDGALGTTDLVGDAVAGSAHLGVRGANKGLDAGAADKVEALGAGFGNALAVLELLTHLAHERVVGLHALAISGHLATALDLHAAGSALAVLEDRAGGAHRLDTAAIGLVVARRARHLAVAGLGGLVVSLTLGTLGADALRALTAAPVLTLDHRGQHAGAVLGGGGLGALDDNRGRPDAEVALADCSHGALNDGRRDDGHAVGAHGLGALAANERGLHNLLARVAILDERRLAGGLLGLILDAVGALAFVALRAVGDDGLADHTLLALADSRGGAGGLHPLVAVAVVAALKAVTARALAISADGRTGGALRDTLGALKLGALLAGNHNLLLLHTGLADLLVACVTVDLDWVVLEADLSLESGALGTLSDQLPSLDAGVLALLGVTLGALHGDNLQDLFAFVVLASVALRALLVSDSALNAVVAGTSGAFGALHDKLAVLHALLALKHSALGAADLASAHLDASAILEVGTGGASLGRGLNLNTGLS